MPYRPIIYVRGYAGTQAEVEETVDDPFYGFNIGSTHYRVNQHGKADFFVFESPFVRLMTDHRYSDVYDGFTQQLVAGQTKERTIWIYRFYDRTSKTYDRPGGFRLSIEQAATELKWLVDRVKKETGAEKVFLVAHSMGGLVCRSLIQKIYPDSKEKPSDHIDKMVTYGTPHGGIAFDTGLGWAESIRDAWGPNDADVFGRKRMYEYLTPGIKSIKKESLVPKAFDPKRVPTKAFDTNRILCIVGTNARDYKVAYGMSRWSVGPQSDGLVQIENAWVPGAHQAFIHRCHSGRYGMVNSEEGYQNLQRFLFGDVMVKTRLNGFKLDFPAGQEISYHIEISLAIVNLPMLMQDRSMDHYSPISINAQSYKELRKDPAGLFLFSHFLRDCANPGDRIRYTVRLAIYRQRYRHGVFQVRDHLEGLPLWSDHLIVEIERLPSNASLVYRARYSWVTDLATTGKQDPTVEIPFKVSADKTRADGTIPLPARAGNIFGPNARLDFETYDWD